MPNNSNARREKDKKKQSKKKEDKASTDSNSLSLSLAGKDKANMDSGSLSLSLAGTDTTADHLDPGYADLREPALLLKFTSSLTQDERIDMRKRIREANPEASIQMRRSRLSIVLP
jgi:hypothetical protein